MGRSGSTARHVLGLALVLLAATGTPARAQSAAAEALFNDGDRLFAAGQIAEACDAFDASNKLEQRAGTLIRLGECREKQGRRASAWSAYRDALARVRDPNKRKIAEDRVAALEPTLSKVTISVPDANRVVGLEVVRNGVVINPVLWNRTVPIDGGEYVVIARAAGHVEQTQTVTIPPEGGNVTILIPALAHTPVEAPPVAPAPDPIPAVRRDRPSTLTGRRKVALGVGGVAVVAIVAGAVLGAGAKGLEDDAYLLCPDPEMACGSADRANDLLEQAASRSLYANVALGVGVGAAIGAAVLWFTGAPSSATETTVGVRPTVAPGYVGASYGVAF